MFKKRYLWWALPVFAVIAIIMGCTSNPMSRKPYLIGMLFNLKGPYALVEDEAMRGAELAFMQLPTHHESLSEKLGYHFYDGRSDERLVIKEARKLAGEKKVIAGLGFCITDMVLAAAPYFAKHDKVFIGTGATSPAIPKDYPGYAFIVAFGDNSQAAAAAEYAYNTLNFRKAAILFDQDLLYSRQLARYFAESFTAWDGTIVSVQGFSRDAEDISAQIGQILSLSDKPDLIYLACGPEEPVIIIPQLRAAGLDQTIFGGDTFDNRGLIESDKMFNSVYFTTHLMLDAETTDPALNQFLKDYITTFDTYPRTPFCALGYDAANLLFNAIERAGSFEPAKVRDALIHTRDFEGVTGKISYFDNDLIPVKPIVIVEIEHDRRFFKTRLTPQRVPAAESSKVELSMNDLNDQKNAAFLSR